MRTSLLVTSMVLAAGTAHAQEAGNKPAPIRPPGPPQIVAPTTPPGSTVVVGQDVDKGGPGANTTVARSATGADTLTTDSASGGNAEQPARGVPLTGGSGGGGQ